MLSSAHSARHAKLVACAWRCSPLATVVPQPFASFALPCSGTPLLHQDDCEDVAALENQHQFDHEDADVVVAPQFEDSRPRQQRQSPRP